MKEMEISMMRVEERKKFHKDMDQFKNQLMQEYSRKEEKLREREEKLELEYLEKKQVSVSYLWVCNRNRSKVSIIFTQSAEASLFDLRQTLISEMDSLRHKESDLQAKVEMDFMKFSNEHRRLQALEANLKQRESIMAKTLEDFEREKESQLFSIRKGLEENLQAREDELAILRLTLEKESKLLASKGKEFLEQNNKILSLEATLMVCSFFCRISLCLSHVDKDSSLLEDLT